MNIPNKFKKIPCKACKKKWASTSFDIQNRDPNVLFNKKPILLQFTSLQAARNQVKLKKNYSFSSLQEARYKFKANKTSCLSQNTWENVGISAKLDSCGNYQRNRANIIKYSGEEYLISQQSSISKSKSLSSLEIENFETDSDTSICLTPPISYESSKGGNSIDYYSDSTFCSSASPFSFLNSATNNSENIGKNEKRIGINKSNDESQVGLIKSQNSEDKASLDLSSANKIDKYSIEFNSNCKENLKRKNNDDSEVNHRSKRFKFSSSEFAHNNDLHRNDSTN